MADTLTYVPFVEAWRRRMNNLWRFIIHARGLRVFMTLEQRTIPSGMSHRDTTSLTHAFFKQLKLEGLLLPTGQVICFLDDPGKFCHKFDFIKWADVTWVGVDEFWEWEFDYHYYYWMLHKVLLPVNWNAGVGSEVNYLSTIIYEVKRKCEKMLTWWELR